MDSMKVKDVKEVTNYLVKKINVGDAKIMIMTFAKIAYLNIFKFEVIIFKSYL